MTFFVSKAEQQVSNFSYISTAEAFAKNSLFKYLVLTCQLISFQNHTCMSIRPFLTLILNALSNNMTTKAALSKTRQIFAIWGYAIAYYIATFVLA